MNEIGEFHKNLFLSLVMQDKMQHWSLIPTYTLFNPSLGGVYYAYDKKV